MIITRIVLAPLLIEDFLQMNLRAVLLRASPGCPHNYIEYLAQDRLGIIDGEEIGELEYSSLFTAPCKWQISYDNGCTWYRAVKMQLVIFNLI